MSYETASRQFEGREPRYRETAIDDYNRADDKTQKAVALEYLEDQELYEDFHAYRDSKEVLGDWLEDIKTFCEESKGFWNWLTRNYD